MTTSITLRQAIDMSNHVDCASFEIEKFDNQGDNKIVLRTEESTDLSFELDTTQLIELDDNGIAMAADTEGQSMRLRFMVTTPLRIEKVPEVEVPHQSLLAEDATVARSTDGGDTWVAMFTDTLIRFNDADCTEEWENKDLVITVTPDGLTVDLVGQESCEVLKTVSLDIAALLDMLVVPPVDHWAHDAVQFPRLLCEINATQAELDIPAIAQAMDLQADKVIELLDRTHVAWEAHKERTL